MVVISIFSLIIIFQLLNSQFKISYFYFYSGIYTRNLSNSDAIIGVLIDKAKNSYRVNAEIGSNVTGSFPIRLPTQFSRKKHDSLSRHIKFTGQADYEHGRYFYYKIDGDSPYISEEFEGDVFPNIGREFIGNFSIDLDGTAIGPVKVTIMGLDGVHFHTALPKPGEANDYYKTFVLSKNHPTETGLPWNTIEVRGEDQNAAYRRDVIVLMCGIIIGVFSSIIASVVLSAVEFYEGRWRERNLSGKG
jgi:hypothetical protein